MMAGSAAKRHAATNLPAELTSFVGRRRERADARALLSESRLVTLTGPGGVGKTRLAWRLADDLHRTFTHGIWFVSLGELSDAEWLPHTVAGSLGLQGRSNRTAPESLVEHLRQRDALLVLDNCEHLVDACAMLIDTLLRTCPGLKVVATSREPLRIWGEAIYSVLPLASPPRGVEESTALRQYESVGLFIDRARAVVPGFELTESNRRAVADICRRLEGIPLAIELAAVRLRAMSPDEIARHLAQHADILTLGSRTAPGRQRTMTASIEWSFSLCSTEERELWARSSVFAGGFELEAARAVCAANDEAVERMPDLLQSLVDKSILVTHRQQGRTRYRMLPPIRQRGAQHLQELGEFRNVRRRHRDWYVELAERAEREWLGPRQLDWIEWLRREQGNFRVALEYCYTEPGEAEPGLRMGASLLEFGMAEGLFRPGRLWFDRLLSQAPKPTFTRLRALRTACWWAAMQGDLARADQFLDEARCILHQLDEPDSALIDQAAGFVALFTGDLEQSIKYLTAALHGFRARGDHAQCAHTLAVQSLSYTLHGDYWQAFKAHTECVALTEPVNELWYRSYSLGIAGLAVWHQGDPETAVSLENQSLRLKRLMNEQLGIGLCLEAIAWITTAQAPERAAELIGAAQNQWDAIETSTSALPGLSHLHEQAVYRVRDALGNDSYEAAWRSGNQLTTAAAVRLALDETAGEVADRPAGSPSHTDLMTKRERQIAELVARGFTNKDIAGRLVIAKRTVDTHIEHILSKFGFHSRNQIIAWMTEQQALDTGARSPQHDL
ncbi:ATP-binding protein [Haloechinothrix alba]|nr:LuxR C-terminal-related transcriptional regulator [Haloechinothrix alba]